MAHNNVLDIGYRSGLLSAIVFIVFLISLLISATFILFSFKKNHTKNNGPQKHYPILIGVLLCFWSINLSGVFDSTLFSVGVTVGALYWFLLGVLIKVTDVYFRERKINF